MHENYNDIKDRIEELPYWYDEYGTPRYGAFDPDLCPDIYSSHVGLFLIACQHCGKTFKVEMHADIWDRNLRHPPKKWHYGDPPVHNCTGDTMNCDDLEVLEFWNKDNRKDPRWERVPEFEGKIDNE
jgi:hypothetical protein